MKKGKELIAVLMAGAMVLSLAACGGKQEAAPTTTAPAPAQTEAAGETKAEAKETEAEAAEAEKKDSYTFGYIAYDMTDIWNEYASKAFEYAAGQADVKVETIVLDSKNSLEESVTAMESLIQQEVDGISIFPISTEQGAQLVKMANEAGIPVTVENFAMDIDDPGDYIASVACEYDQIGYAAIKYIAENKPGAKVFFCAGQQGAGDGDYRDDGAFGSSRYRHCGLCGGVSAKGRD